MKCGITGMTGDHIPFDIADYSIPIDEAREVIKDFIFYSEKVENTLTEISIYMTKEYKRYDNDILTFYGVGKKPPDINGVAYIFSDLRTRIRGEIFIVPIWYIDRDIINFFYIFRTIINTPFDICPCTNESFKFYNKFKDEINADIMGLGLTRVDKQYNFNIPNLPKNVYLHPIIFKYIENLDLQSFDDFMTKIEGIAEKYSLQSIGRRCKDFGIPIK